jgi:polyhydroxyalkanoate synthesis repressor PhaR
MAGGDSVGKAPRPRRRPRVVEDLHRAACAEGVPGGPITGKLMETVKEAAGSAEKPRRVIKRYSNRKLYDTKDSRYVTLQQIGEMVRAGEEVQIIDNATKEDKTEVTLALIISEDLKSQPRSVPLGTLRDLIQERGERLLSQLREGPIGRLIPGVGEPGAPGPLVAGSASPAAPTTPEVPTPAPSNPAAEAEKHGAKARITEMVESSKQTIEQWQHTIDDRIRAIVPGVSHFRELQSEVTRLTLRVAELEAHLNGGITPPAHTGAVTNGEKPAGEGAADEGSVKQE